ncbi:protein KTI12 homolog [Convolutriloba macropyga]|uniref:protein KTI12 homolog n=1 Tax=Convolutriloba macropyga TaxID=536237 RepID=UPI003F520AA8
MPLLLIVGPPCCGKSSLAKRLNDFFEANSSIESVTMISDDLIYADAAKSRDILYKDASLEKQMRGRLKDEVTRVLNSTKLVILDAQNYIKGFRYELYCVVKAAKTTQCVIYLNSTLDQSLSLNKTSNLYSEETIRALYLRFEAPQPKARWDSPLYEVYPESIDELSLDSIKQSLTSGNVLPPNMSTQNPPRMGAETLYDLDKLTQKLCAQIMSKLVDCEIGDTITLNTMIGDMNGPTERLKVTRKLSMPELQRIRRHFLEFYKSHTFKDPNQVPTVFFQFVSNSML